jgi:hypothetical protein
MGPFAAAWWFARWAFHIWLILVVVFLTPGLIVYFVADNNVGFKQHYSQPAIQPIPDYTHKP